VKRILIVGSMVGLLLVGVIGFAQTAVTPRVGPGVLLFDNNTGVQTTKLAIVFTGTVPLAVEDIVAVGGGAVTLLAVSNNYVYITVVVDAGGTVAITLPVEYAAAEVTGAFWF
jgi:hypothetical protein